MEYSNSPIIGKQGKTAHLHNIKQEKAKFKRTKFIDLRGDFGFKKLFFEEPNRDLLISFLNEVMKGNRVITDIAYYKTEFPGDTQTQATAILDLVCTSDDGSKFLLEMQRIFQRFFVKRSIYYTSRMISSMAPVGGKLENTDINWDYNIDDVFFIGVLDRFTLEGTPEDEYLHDICLGYRKTGKVFHEGLGYIYVELLKFEKQEHELETLLDKWLYVLKNMSGFDEIPKYFRKTIFEKVFKIATYSNLTKDEKMAYDLNLRKEWDAYSQLTSAEARGEERGEARGKLEGKIETQENVIRNMITKLSLSDEQIATATEAAIDYVRKIRESLKK